MEALGPRLRGDDKGVAIAGTSTCPAPLSFPRRRESRASIFALSEWKPWVPASAGTTREWPPRERQPVLHPCHSREGGNPGRPSLRCLNGSLGSPPPRGRQGSGHRGNVNLSCTPVIPAKAGIQGVHL